VAEGGHTQQPSQLSRTLRFIGRHHNTFYVLRDKSCACETRPPPLLLESSDTPGPSQQRKFARSPAPRPETKSHTRPSKEQPPLLPPNHPRHPSQSSQVGPGLWASDVQASASVFPLFLFLPSRAPAASRVARSGKLNMRNMPTLARCVFTLDSSLFFFLATTCYFHARARESDVTGIQLGNGATCCIYWRVSQGILLSRKKKKERERTLSLFADNWLLNCSVRRRGGGSVLIFGASIKIA
jgi:hypothetical protein